MKTIKIEDINLLNKKGIWWIIILGLFPVFGPLIGFAIFIVIQAFGIRLTHTPFFCECNNKSLGSARSWGIFFLIITAVYAILIGVFIDHFLILPLRIFILLPLFTLVIGLYLFTYGKRYNNYIRYVNSFLNDVMMKNQLNNHLDSQVILKKKDRKVKDMLKDLQRNNILKIEDRENSDEKMISFTPEFQKILSHT